MTDTIKDLHTREDELLVVRCQLGERPAFDDLIDRWHAPLWKYARRLTGSDDAAQEVAQDVWLRVLRGIHRLRDGARLRAWLFGIARRAAHGPPAGAVRRRRPSPTSTSQPSPPTTTRRWPTTSRRCSRSSSGCRSSNATC